MFGIAGTAELSTFCPGTGTWNRLQDGNMGVRNLNKHATGSAGACSQSQAVWEVESAGK